MRYPFDRLVWVVGFALVGLLGVNAQAAQIELDWWESQTNVTGCIIETPAGNVRLGSCTSGSIQGSVALPFAAEWQIEFEVKNDDQEASNANDFVDVFINGTNLGRFQNRPVDAAIPVDTVITGSEFQFRFDFSSENSTRTLHQLIFRGVATAIGPEPSQSADVFADAVVASSNNFFFMGPAGSSLPTSPQEAVTGANIRTGMGIISGNSAFVEVAFIDNVVVNRPGPDVILYESSGTTAGSFRVSLTPGGPQVTLGTTSTGLSYDQNHSYDDIVRNVNIYRAQLDLSSLSVPDGQAINRLVIDMSQDIQPDLMAVTAVRLETTGDLGADGVGGLGGVVTDIATGLTVADALLELNPGGAVALSDAEGRYDFGTIDSGLYDMTVSAQGYAPRSLSFQINGNSSSNVEVDLSRAVGGVASIAGLYSGPAKRALYLNFVPVIEEFIVVVDWADADPDTVVFSTPLTSKHGVMVDGDPTRWRAFFDMGFDFGPGGTLEVIATPDGGEPFPAFEANLKVVEAPAGVLGSAILEAAIDGRELSYSLPEVGIFDASFKDEGGPSVPGDLPLFGGEELNLGVSVGFDGSIGSNGAGRINLFNASASGELVASAPKVEIAGISTEFAAGGAILFDINSAETDWLVGGELDLGLGLSVDIPPGPTPFYFATPIGPIYVKGNIESSANLTLTSVGWNDPAGPDWSADISLDPALRATAIAGYGVDGFASAELRLGGGLFIDMRYPVPAGGLPSTKLDLVMTGGVFATSFIGELELLGVECSYDALNDVWNGCDFSVLGFRGAGTADTLRFVSRDYIWSRAGRNAGGDPSKFTLLSQTFPVSDPAMAIGDIGAIMIAVDDFGDRSSVNRTELHAFTYDETQLMWMSLGSVFDDGTGDFNPDVATLPDGDVLLVWEDVGGVLAEPADPNDPAQVEAKLEELKSKLEISASRYDAQTGIWSVPVTLTNDLVFDGTPKVAAAPNGTAIAVWGRNSAGVVTGSVADPSDIMYATYDGMNWSAPMVAGAGVPSIIKPSVAWNGAEAWLLYAVDTDEDLSTPDDRELVVMNWDVMNWVGPAALTDNMVEDASPQVVWDADLMSWLVAWYQAGDLFTSTLPGSLADASVAVDLTGPAAATSDFRLVTRSGGVAALIWQAPSGDAVDLNYSLRATDGGSWTLPQDLTDDDAMERSVAGVIDGSGDIVLAFNDVETLYETRTIDVNGEPVDIDGVPVGGMTDLVTLSYTPVTSVALEPGSLEVSSITARPNVPVTVSATVVNNGDTTLDGVVVAFYDADPMAGGVELGRTIGYGPVIGGQSLMVSGVITTPDVTAPVELWAVVDPDAVLVDASRDDNADSISGFMLPDLEVVTVGSQTAGPFDRILSARIRNAGGTPVDLFDVTFYAESDPATPLAFLTSPAVLLPGAYVDMSYRWEGASRDGRSDELVSVIVDELGGIPDADRGNNASSTRLFDAMLLPCSEVDRNADQVLDYFDLVVLLRQFDDGSPSADLDGDGVLTSGDILLAVDLLEAGCP